MTAPLADIVVVSVEQAVSAPYATRLLADLGASVIKVERPEGDFARGYDTAVAGAASFFVWANRGKSSTVLDLSQADDRAALGALISGADVFVQNLAPDSAQRFGLSSDQLRRDRPSLIACDISGYGPGGPRQDDRAYDLAIQAEAGAWTLSGSGEPTKIGFSVADISAGMFAALSILAALFRRERTDEGASITVPMLDTLSELLSAPLYQAVHGGLAIGGSPRRHHSIAPYGTFTLADGRVVLIAVQNDREWQRLCRDVLARPELAADVRMARNTDRIAHVADVESVVQGALNALVAEEALRRLTAADITVARVNTMADVWEHEQLRARERFVQVDVMGSPVELLASPFQISGWTPAPGSVPSLGHSSTSDGRHQ